MDAVNLVNLPHSFDDQIGSFSVNKQNWSAHNVPKSKRLESKYWGRINLGDIHDNRGNQLKMSISMKQHIDKTQNNIHTSRYIRNKDKKDRATTEMVLDHRTKCILYGILNKKLVYSIHGCISTGKEANVYYALNKDSTKEFALKIYKTSILSFKDRARYVRGEFRFDRGYSKNPRKMVQLWAEKEFRNLHRIYSAFIPSPKPIYVRQNVLLMNVIGSNGIIAPRLKDYKFNSDNINIIYNYYFQVIKYMRLLYWKCNLIHADLSEYNMLLYNNLIYIIDVSQSVEPSHPNSYEFLAKDCKNVNDYFRKQCIMTLNDLELFEYILDERHLKLNNTSNNNTINKNKHKNKHKNAASANNNNNDIDFEFVSHHPSWNDVIDLSLLNRMKLICKQRWDDMTDMSCSDQINDNIGLKSKIPRSLFEIDDHFQIHRNKAKYESVTKFLLKSSGGMHQMDKFNDDNDNKDIVDDDDNVDIVDIKDNLDNVDVNDDDKDDKDDDKDDADDDIPNGVFPLSPYTKLMDKNKLTKEEIKQMRKANKKIVKASNRERRKHKMPKKVKKRKIKVARRKIGKSVWKG